MKDKLKYVSNNLRSYRARAGYSQEQLAEILRVSRTTYCDYEVNPQKVKVETLQQIADILNCKLADFFVEINVTNSNINNLEIKEE